MSIVVALLALAACRGEPVPRDYQNAPPDVSHPAQTKTDTPAQHGAGDAPPQPSTGNEGTAGPYEPMTTDGGTTATSMPDTPPTTTT
jgi:hypothetical protein